jgi:ribonucleotide monophosphatase NagD (HAD superfamily)
MFSNQKKKRYAAALRLTEEELEEYARNLANFLNKSEKITKNQIINSIYIYENIIKKRKPKQNKVYNYGNMRNLYVKKHAEKIMRLRAQGHGSALIVKSLKLDHRIDVSRSSIDKFLKLNEVQDG